MAPPQLAQAQRATEASVVLVSVGANDVRWSDLVTLRAASPSCDDQASTAFFQNRLARFAHQVLRSRLAALNTVLRQGAETSGDPIQSPVPDKPLSDRHLFRSTAEHRWTDPEERAYGR
ncbi:hypothetical protein ABT063_24215 [Streptomyces sp. NPDC002838]|uniref:hypothetical protein n=1 Tax=Streptomyces sp. NPDC002838 TaxID=3154436 RepID=UPI00332BF24C